MTVKKMAASAGDHQSKTWHHLSTTDHDSGRSRAGRDRALRVLFNSPGGDYESRMRAGLAANKAGLDFIDWMQWLESVDYKVDAQAMSRRWYLFQFVSSRAMQDLFPTFFAEAA